MAANPKILIVEDDSELRNALVVRLSHGFAPIAVEDAEGMQEELSRNADIKVILLDILLPGSDGLTLCRELRRNGNPFAEIPVIMLSALGEPTDRVAGLNAGADDYISKPFFTAELIARIEAVLRRTSRSCTETADQAKKSRFGEWTLYCDTRQLVNDNGLVVMLTLGDYKLLRLFLENPGKILSREQIIEYMGSQCSSPQNLSVNIRRLRAKLGESAKKNTYIQAYRNEGYMWKPTESND